MEEMSEKRKSDIMHRIESTERKVEETISKQRDDLELRKELENLKRKDREETVKRINKI